MLHRPKRFGQRQIAPGDLDSSSDAVWLAVVNGVNPAIAGGYTAVMILTTYR